MSTNPTGSTAVAVAAPHQPSFLEIISRAASDPSVDVQKMQAILEMQRTIMAEQSRIDFAASMRAVQEEIVPVVRDAENAHSHSRYARLETVDKAIRPIYTKHGFSLTFNSPQSDKDDLTVSCTVLHDRGHSRDYSLSGALDNAGSQGKSNKTAIQALGSSVSYLRRYLTAMIFNVVLTNEDNDGNRVQRETQAEVGERRIAEERAKMASSPAAAPRVASDRPVPAELQQMFADLAKPGALAAAAKQMQDWLIEAGGREGNTIYQNVFGNFRARFPKGTVMPIPDLKLCFLELWDELVAFRAKPKTDVEKSKSGQQNTERGAAAEVPGSPSTSAGGTGTTKKPTSRNYKMLGKFRDKKADLFRVFESDDCYYRILKRNGFEQSNEIMDEAVGMAILADMKNAFDDRMLIIEQRGTHVETATEAPQYQPADSDVPF